MGCCVFTCMQTSSLFHWKYSLCFKHYMTNSSYHTPCFRCVAVLQMLTNSVCSFFKDNSWTGSEMSHRWALFFFFYFQGGSFAFHLKASHSRSEFAVSINSPRSWQRSRAFLKFTSVQGEPVGSSWERGSITGPPGHRMTCCFSTLNMHTIWKEVLIPSREKNKQ